MRCCTCTWGSSEASAIAALRLLIVELAKLQGPFISAAFAPAAPGTATLILDPPTLLLNVCIPIPFPPAEAKAELLAFSRSPFPSSAWPSFAAGAATAAGLPPSFAITPTGAVVSLLVMFRFG